MAKKNFFKLSVLLGVATLLCFMLSVVFAVKAENYNESQEGVTIRMNYDISTADDGKYANLLLNKNADLSDYYKLYYSGGEIDFKNGYLYEADATGITSSVQLFEEHSGTFSIVGQGFYDAYGTENSVFVADYGRLTFKFTNSLNNKQYYKFSFTQTASHYLELNVYYFDEEVQATALNRITKKISMSFTEKSAYMNNKNLPFRFEYIMETQTLNMRDETVSSGATHNLNTLAGATLPVFESYSVDMIFENKSQQNTAKFIVFELCGKIPNDVIVDGFDIQTANDGAYSDYFIDSSTLTEYFIKNYSGNYINFNSGRLYETSKKGTTSTVRLLEENSGEFSIIGQGFYDNYTAASSGFTGDFGRLAFQFTNADNAQQYYKFSFSQSSYHYLELNVYYYDKDVQSTYLNKVTKNICASFTETAAYFNNKTVPFMFKYDMANGKLNIRDASAVVAHDLSTAMFSGATLPVFENYTVDMLFENKSQTTTAKFVCYELCGQAFAETVTLNVTDMAGTTVSEIGLVKGAKYVLPENETKGFVGYKVQDKIYPAGYALKVTENTTAQAMVVTPTMVSGASIRNAITDDYTGGLRFLVNVEDSVMNAFGENIAMYGVLIYTDNINGEFDLNEEGSQCGKLANYFIKEEVRGYYITLTNIKANHYQTSYSVRAYVEVTLYDGSTVKVATDYSEEHNARSPYQVAQKAEQDGITGTMIDTYLGRASN